MYYKLAPSRNPNLQVDKVIYANDSETGEPQTISVSEAADLTEDEAARLRGQGFVLLESSEPVEEKEGGLVVGDDVRGASPTFQVTPPGTSEVHQPASEEPQGDEVTQDQSNESPDEAL